jgi:hypothetical protein
MPLIITCFGHYHAHHQELATIMLITALVVSSSVRCKSEVRCGYAGVVSGLRAKARDSDQSRIPHTWFGPVSGGSNQSGIQVMGPCTVTGDLDQSGILISGSSPMMRPSPISKTDYRTWYYEQRSTPTGYTTYGIWSYGWIFRIQFCQSACQITACYLHATASTTVVPFHILPIPSETVESWNNWRNESETLLAGPETVRLHKGVGQADTWYITAGKTAVSTRW